MKSIVLSFFISILALLLIPHQSLGGEPTANDPRLLSEIKLPSTNFDVSNDGNLIYTIFDNQSNNLSTQSDHQITLNIYDISSPQYPNEISSTFISERKSGTVLSRNGIIFLLQPQEHEVLIIDARDPKAPQVAGHVEVGYDLSMGASEDASVFAHWGPRNDYHFLNTADPSNSWDILSNDTLIDSDFVKWSRDSVATIDGIQDTHISDYRDNKILLYDPGFPSILNLYDFSSRNTQTLLSRISGPRDWITVRIIPKSQNLLFAARGDNGQAVLKIISAVETQFDLGSILNIHDFIASKYSECSDNTNNIPECIDLKYRALAQLKDAGIEALFDHSFDLATERRASILNDYAFWIYQWISTPAGLEEAQRILRRVTELWPEFAEARRNLGDVDYALLHLANTEDTKIELWNEANESFKRYRELTSADALNASRISSFPLPEILRASSNICDYVARAANQDTLELISSPTGTAEDDGKIIKFIAGWSPSLVASREIRAVGCEGPWCSDNRARLGSLKFDESFPIAQLYIIPYRGRYYTVSGRPDKVIDPHSGSVCKLDHRYTQVLVEKNAPGNFCQRYSNGEFKHNVKWTPASPDYNNSRSGIVVGNGYSVLDRIIDLDLGNNKMAHIGHFNDEWDGGSGCLHSGVVILNGDVPSQDELNKSLINYQSKWWKCASADADLTRVDDKIYIDAWEGTTETSYGSVSFGSVEKPAPTRRPSRVLLEMIGGSFRPICRIQQKLTTLPGVFQPHP